jgi:hypothetical protein
MCGADVREGLIRSGAGIVGSIQNFKPNFVRKGEEAREPLRQVDKESVWQRKDAANLGPDWTLVDTHLRAMPEGQVITIDTPGRVRIKFGAHPASGIVSVNGEEIDLFHVNSLVPLVHTCQGPVTLRRLDKKSPESRGTHVLIECVELETEEVQSAGYRRIPLNRARPFRARAMNMLQEVPPDGFMLDIGGGRRMLDDSRYFNMEYDFFDEADLYGDAQALPFKDNCVDFVHSTAVFEHLPEPNKAAQEIYRVLKPGGKAYVVTAFMQPVHSEPQHFYNASIYGMEQWFSMFPKRKLKCGGEFVGTLMTLVKAGARAMPPEKLEAIRLALEEGARYSTPEDYSYIASEIVIEVQK